MSKQVKVEKSKFDAALRKMLGTPPVPRTKIGKSKKKLAQIIEPLKFTR